MRAAGQTSALYAYRVSAVLAVRNVKPAYDTYESENYRIVPDNEAGCFDIYNKQGERIGAFDYSDIKVRQDSQTGKGMRPLRRPTSINIPIWYMIKTPHTYGLIWRLRDWHSTRIMGLFVWALMGCPIMTIQIIRTIGAFCFREIPIRRFLTGCRTTGEVLKKCRNLLHGRMCLRALAVTMSGYGLMKKKDRGI